MKSIQILKHSIRQVFGNFGMAMRISGLLWAGLNLAIYLLLPVGGIASLDALDQMSPTQAVQAYAEYPFALLYGVIAIQVVITAWIAVSWHRYILLSERPDTILPRWRGGRIFSYIWGTVLMVLVVSLLLFVVGIALFVVMKIISPFFNLTALAWVVPLFFFVFIVYFIFRISLVLPARALGQEMSFKESWNITQPVAWTVFWVSVLLGVIEGALNIFVGLFTGNIGYILSLIAAWITIMIGVSVLTTLYGHLVEKRDLV